MADIDHQLSRLSEQLHALSGKLDEAAEKWATTDSRLGDIESRLQAVEDATSYNLTDWINRHWKIVVALSLPVPFVFTAFMVGVWQMKGDAVISFLREELQQASENDTILFQPAGLSFIKSPVEFGGSATYVLVAKRTSVGEGCTYINTVPIFTDELGRSLSGPFQSRGRQYTTEMTRTELSLEVPRGLTPGRVVSELQITYDCDGERITHRTYPIAFELLPDG